MSSDSNKVFLTQDGSSSLMSKKFGEAYHSRYGALEESNHVFIDAGLKYQIAKTPKQINVLEIGFGTGLNAVLTYLEAANHPKINIHYHGLEAYPIELNEAIELNYSSLLDLNHEEFIQFHKCEWNRSHALRSNFEFTKHLIKFESFESNLSFDLIYFDAFAPSVQNHLWEIPFLKKIYNLCNEGAALVTYCAKGSFKRALKECGFSLEPLPGPAKKREMTRAIKSL